MLFPHLSQGDCGRAGEAEILLFACDEDQANNPVVAVTRHVLHHPDGGEGDGELCEGDFCILQINAPAFQVTQDHAVTNAVYGSLINHRGFLLFTSKIQIVFLDIPFIPYLKTTFYDEIAKSQVWCARYRCQFLQNLGHSMRVYSLFQGRD